MLKDLINSEHIYIILKTIYEKKWSYFTLSQLVKPYQLDKGNTTRYLKKMCSSGLIGKLDDSNVYVIDRENLAIQAIFNLIKLESIRVTYSSDKHIFLKYEKYFRGKHLHQSRVEGAPFFLSIVCEAEQTVDPRKQDCHHRFMPYVMNKGHIDRYLSYEDLHRVTTILFDEAAQGKEKYLEQRISSWSDDWDTFDVLSQELLDKDMEGVGQAEIAQLCNNYVHQYIKSMCRSSILEACRFDFIPHATQAIAEDVDDNFSLGEIVRICSLPTFQTYITQSKVELLHLALQIQNNYPDIYDMLIKEPLSANMYEGISSSYPLLAHEIEQFRHSHCTGISFSRVRNYTWHDIITTMQQRFLDDVNISEQIDLITTSLQNNTHQIDTLKAACRSETTRCLVSYIEQVTTLKNISTRKVLSLHQVGNKLLEKAASIMNCSLDLLLSMSYDEVLLYLHGLLIPDEKKLLERMNYSFCIQKDHRYYFYLGEEADQLHAAVLQDTTRHFTGMRGSVIRGGCKVGKVHKITQPYDNELIKQGDIVIARQATDCHFQYMGKIAALLLEEELRSVGLIDFSEKFPHIPVITHVDGLMARLENEDIIHIDGGYGRITILEKHGEKKYGALTNNQLQPQAKERLITAT